MYGKPSRRLISRVFEKGSAREPFLRLIIAPKSIRSCPGYAGQTNKWREKSKTNIHEPVTHTDANRETDTCLLMIVKETERDKAAQGKKTHTEKMTSYFFLQINQEEVLSSFSAFDSLTGWRLQILFQLRSTCLHFHSFVPFCLVFSSAILFLLYYITAVM